MTARVSSGRRVALVVLAGASLLALAALAAAFLGPPGGMGPERVARALLGGEGSELDRAILVEVRLPRIALGALVGMALGGAGAVFQALLRNPLADPFVVGVSGSASLGVLVALLLGGGGALLLPAAGMAGGLVGILLVVLLARAARGGEASLALVLAGVAVSTLSSAIVMLALSLVPSALPSMVFWVMGDLSAADPGRVRLALPYVFLSLGTATAGAYRLNLLSLGDEEAASLGASVSAERGLLLAAGATATAAAVSVAGTVGFVGLIVPHAVRAAAGSDYRGVVPGSALAGGALVVAADALARRLGEVPVGALTAFLGVPFFLVLLARRSRAG